MDETTTVAVLCLLVMLSCGAAGAVAYYKYNTQSTDLVTEIVTQVLAAKASLLTESTSAPMLTKSVNPNVNPTTTTAPAVPKVGTPLTSTAATTTKAPAALTFIKDNKAVLIAVPIQVAMTIAEKAVARLITGKTEQGILKYSTKLASRALQTLGQKVGEDLLVRLGVRSAARVGTVLAEQTAVSAASGPGAPFVEAAQLCFDALSLSLDVGDAGGYLKMGTKKMYLDMKTSVDAQFQKAFTDQGVAWPVVAGPLDSLSATDYSTAVTANVNTIIATDGNKYMAPLKAALTTWITQNPNAQEADIDAWTNTYLTQHPLDYDALTADAISQLCTTKGGTPKADGSCGWATEKACLTSYSWPLKANDQYAEWTNGQCQLASQGLRGICEQNGLTYNQDTHLCNVTQDYCKTKGANWTYDSTIKDYDCHIPTGQAVAEAIFGTTIVRGLKQVFDPAQYQKCNAGEIDDGYFCRTTNCPADKDKDGALCYPKCNAGYAGVGPVCYSTCPAGATDDGAFCRTVGCDSTQDSTGGLCYPKCPAGYSGVGPICYATCPLGFSDAGVTCTKPGSYGRGAGYPWKFGDGLNLNKAKARCEKANSQGCEQSGAIMYPKCRSGFHAVGCCTCSPDCPSGFTDAGAFCTKPTHNRGVGTPKTHITAKSSYGRSAGTPAVSIYAKKRLIPYSTKKN